MEQEQGLYHKARRYIPGGVCAAHRVNQFLGSPFYVSRGAGSKLYDLSGKEYIDFNMSFGAALLGHGDRQVSDSLRKVLDLGVLCSMETEYQVAAAEKIAETIPCVDMVRFTLTGTEATWYAIKLAREYTGREKIVKFEGHFHGWNDYLQYSLWPSKDQALPIIKPDYDGTPRALDDLIIALPFNDTHMLEQTLVQQRSEIAAVILEPINYNSGGILPKPQFLQALRELTRQLDIVLIFDEVLSGFKTGPDCAQGYLGVFPDLCTLGKAVGGGMPLSVFGGRREIMEHIAPLGQAMHSGTYNGHLSSIMACLAFFDQITQPNFYPSLLDRCERLYQDMNRIFERRGFPARANGIGARFGIFFGSVIDEEITDYQVAMKTDRDLANRFFETCLRQGLYFHPGWHHGISAAHTKKDVGRALEGIDAAAKELVSQS